MIESAVSKGAGSLRRAVGLRGGSGELASTWNIDGRAAFIADSLIAEGKALPMIIVMPNHQVVHRSDPKHTELTFPLFEKELRTQIPEGWVAENC